MKANERLPSKGAVTLWYDTGTPQSYTLMTLFLSPFLINFTFSGKVRHPFDRMKLFLEKKRQQIALETIAGHCRISIVKKMNNNPSNDSDYLTTSRLRTTPPQTGETRRKRPPKEPSVSPTTAPCQTELNQQEGTYSFESLQVSDGKTSKPCDGSGPKNAMLGGPHVSDPEERTKAKCGEHEHQIQNQDSAYAQEKSSKTQSSTNMEQEKPSEHVPPRATKRGNVEPWRLIEPWHIVLGDTHARTDRTTEATNTLRKVKEEF